MGANASAMRWLLHVCVLLATLIGLPGAGAQTPERTETIERQVKAAYLYKFASYVEWPDGAFAQADSPLVIGVIGADGLSDELARSVTGRTTNGRAVVVRKLRRGDPVAGLHILYIGQLEKAPLADVLAATKGQPMLTVTESEDAYALGSMINFVVVEDKMRFEVALKPVGLGRLKISARMLAAAYKVAPGAT